MQIEEVKTCTITAVDLVQIGNELFQLMCETEKRGLRSTGTWATELFHALFQSVPLQKKVHMDINNMSLSPVDPEFSKYTLAKFYFDNQEYDRASFFTNDCKSPVPEFLHFYSIYCSGEKKRLDDIADLSFPPEKAKNCTLNSLRAKLEKMHGQEVLDGYGLYLYGLVLKNLKADKTAIDVLCEAIHKEPINWGSWLELSTLIVDRNALYSLSLPDHWLKNFFLAHTYLELHMNELALEMYKQLSDVGFSKSTYIMAQIAIGHHHMKELEKSLDQFQLLLKTDPYRLENLDTYSNLLYVREMRVELSNLAHSVSEIDKYRVETCCVIGNFYSLRKQHEKAVVYFQRALKLNPNYISAFTLIGHEYMEMKNTSGAIQAYRQAIEVNRRDYRAWYGLGQTYEILKLPLYSLYYYKQAQQLKPSDSRMLVALGDAFEQLQKLEDAKKCYWHAHAVGDVEGMALNKLAKVYCQMSDDEHAAAAYNDYIHFAVAGGSNDRDDLCHAYLFLAKYYFKEANLEKAYENAQECMEFPETKEDAKSILRLIAVRRVEADSRATISPFHMADTPEPYLTPMNISFTP